MSDYSEGRPAGKPSAPVSATPEPILPDWTPATDGELAAWAHGYFAGWHRGYADAAEQECAE